MVELGQSGLVWENKIWGCVYRIEMLEQCDIGTVVIQIITQTVKKQTVLFHFVAVLLVINQEKGATDGMNSKSSTTQHKQTFSSS